MVPVGRVRCPEFAARVQGVTGEEVSRAFPVRRVFDEANKNNVSLYTVDPRGLTPTEFDVSGPSVDPGTDRQYLNQTIDTLRTLAVETDGRAIVNRNDLAGGMKQIIRDSSGYYLLGYTTRTKADGKFHNISVKVKRPGVSVRSRKGYWALTAPNAAASLAASTGREVVTVRLSSLPPGKDASFPRAQEMLEGVLSSLAGS